MKLKIDWKKLGKQLWEAVKPVLLAAIGGGIVSVAADYSGDESNAATQVSEPETKTTALPINGNEN